MTRASIDVGLGPRTYRIEIGHGLLARAGDAISRFVRRSRLAIITDTNIEPLYLARLIDGLEAVGLDSDHRAIEPGEQSKSWTSLQGIVEWLIALRIERGDLVIALGGGVVGDVAGFAAAILRRGVGLVQIPTSLLAQVDSAVGGKTGINSPQGKNLIGAFHQPLHVLADLDCLDSLPHGELQSGYGEIVKYGLLGDAAFFAWLEDHGAAILAGDGDHQAHAVLTSCRIKAGLVAADETERGKRAQLNLGHTFAHAIEAELGYGNCLTHGEAVAIGCCLAFDVASAAGRCDPAAGDRVRAHLRAVGMRTDLRDIQATDLAPAALIGRMEQDKKVVDGRIRFVLPSRIGAVGLVDDIGHELLCTVLQRSATA